MSSVENKCEETNAKDGKNTTKIYCTFCPSKILNQGTASLINQEFSLPQVQCKDDSDADSFEVISEYWLVENIYTFENISVSKMKDNVKYLACADCERGPVGWHDLATKKSYIALSRVRNVL